MGVLNACTNIAAVEEGRYAHELLFQSGCHSDVFVGNSFVDMYAECGSVEDAQTVFNKMPFQVENSLVDMYAKRGSMKDAQKVFNMQDAISR